MFSELQIDAAARKVYEASPGGEGASFDALPVERREHFRAVADSALSAALALRPTFEEYGADHKYTGVEMVDEEGRPWMDRVDFLAQYADEGDIYTPVVRHVTAWEPLVVSVQDLD